MLAAARPASSPAEFPTIPDARAGAGAAQGMLLALCSTLAVMGVLLMAPILPSLQAAYAGTPGVKVLAPVVMTLPALCVALFSPAAGWLCDRFGRVRLLQASFLAYAPLGVAPLFLHDLHAILLTRFGVGVAEAMVMTASTALIGDYFSGPARERWLAVQVGVSAVAAVLCVLVSGALGAVSWRAPFGVYGLALLLLAASCPLLKEPARRAVADVAVKARLPWGVLLPILGVTVLGAVLFYVIPVQMGFILAAHGVTSPAAVGQVTALGTVAVPVGSYLFGRVARAPVSALLAGSFLLAGAGLLLVAQAPTLPLVVAGVVVNQLGCGLILPGLLTLAMASVPEPLRGRGIGLWTGSFFIGQFLTPLVFVAASGLLGGLGAAVMALGGLGLALGLGSAFVFLRRGHAPLRPGV